MAASHRRNRDRRNHGRQVPYFAAIARVGGRVAAPQAGTRFGETAREANGYPPSFTGPSPSGAAHRHGSRWRRSLGLDTLGVARLKPARRR